MTRLVFLLVMQLVGLVGVGVALVVLWTVDMSAGDAALMLLIGGWVLALHSRICDLEDQV